MQKDTFLVHFYINNMLWIYVVPHVDLVYQEMVCEVSDLNGGECFDFLENFYVHQQQN